MADQAHEWTDEQIERLQRKFRREYNAAAGEMRNKLDVWMKEYDETKKDWQAKVKKGEAKQEDFDGWLSDMAHDHDFIAGMAETLARDAVRADKLAMDYVNDAIPEVYAENANFAAWSVERQLGYDTHAFDLYDQDTVRRMIAEGDIAEGLVLPKPKVDARKDKPWNQRKFTSALTQSILQGESIPNTAKRLQMVLSMDEGVAVRAARTAMTGAENAGRIDSYKRAQSIGIELEQEWLATHDERTRITHRLLDGEHVPVGERFVPDGYGDKYSIGFPGDPTALGEMVYNCRCTLVAWLPSIADKDNRSWAKLPDGMTYDEWKGSRDFDVKPEKGEARTLRARLEEYVGGGYQLEDILTDADKKWMHENERDFTQPLYRIENERFTARRIDKALEDEDEDFEVRFGKTYRSFTQGGVDTLSELLDQFEDAGYDLDDMVVFQTMGTTKAFDMAPYAQAYTDDQKEVLVDDDFEYLGERWMTISGRRIRCILVRRIDW